MDQGYVPPPGICNGASGIIKAIIPDDDDVPDVRVALRTAVPGQIIVLKNTPRAILVSYNTMDEDVGLHTDGGEIYEDILSSRGSAVLPTRANIGQDCCGQITEQKFVRSSFESA
eukprot:GHVH01016273.1.p2 GENE.GHVH01016273.1~~GHVH01016273.1.p2  ORF type:complete len:115 (-),score=5.06 GHVH01016273.1:327-671(-)